MTMSDPAHRGTDGLEQGSMEGHVGLQAPVWTQGPLAREHFILKKVS